MTDAHQIDITPSSERVVVTRDGTTLADTTDALELREGKLPVRYYIPRQDVRLDLLVPTDTHTTCPFKGDASYWAIDGEDVAWTYEDPIPSAKPIEGLVAFYNEKVDIQHAR